MIQSGTSVVWSTHANSYIIIFVNY